MTIHRARKPLPDLVGLMNGRPPSSGPWAADRARYVGPPDLTPVPAPTAFGRVSEVFVDQKVTRTELERLVGLSGGASGGAKAFLETVTASLSAGFDDARGNASLSQTLLRALGQGKAEVLDWTDRDQPLQFGASSRLGAAVVLTFTQATTAPSAELPQIFEAVEVMLKSGAPLAEVLISASVLDPSRKGLLLERLAGSLTDPTDLRLAAAVVLSVSDEASRGRACATLAKNPNLEPEVSTILRNEKKRIDGTDYDAVTEAVKRDLLEGDTAAQERGLDAVKAAIETFQAHLPTGEWTHGPRPDRRTQAVYIAVGSALSVARAARVPIETLLSTPSVRRGLIDFMRDLDAGRATQWDPYNVIATEREEQWVTQGQDFVMAQKPGASGAPKWLKAAQVWAQRQQPSLGEQFLDRFIPRRFSHAARVRDPSLLFSSEVIESARRSDKHQWPPARWTAPVVPKTLADPASRGLFRALDAAAQGVVHGANFDNGGALTSTVSLLDDSSDRSHFDDLVAAVPDLITFFEQAGMRAEVNLHATPPTLRLTAGLAATD